MEVPACIEPTTVSVLLVRPRRENRGHATPSGVGRRIPTFVGPRPSGQTLRVSQVFDSKSIPFRVWPGKFCPMASAASGGQDAWLQGRYTYVTLLTSCVPKNARTRLRDSRFPAWHVGGFRVAQDPLIRIIRKHARYNTLPTPVWRGFLLPLTGRGIGRRQDEYAAGVRGPCLNAARRCATRPWRKPSEGG